MLLEKHGLLSMPVKILFIGDIIGKPGRQALSRELDRLVDRYRLIWSSSTAKMLPAVSG